ncbi:MAG: hypothetical protein Q4A43_02350 [Coriobacteriia bacterium]|nr:hypothetical protein [Coriobacteriia bacterium]
MAQLIDDVTYLSEEIGARPAGTEEEQQAALFVAETLQQDAGFQAVIEDFNGIVNPDLPKAVCFTVAFVCGLISLLVPLLTLPAALISLIAAVLFALEILDKPFLSRFLKGGISQNVVAKYQPAGVPKKRRKIILVANYDSGRVVPDQKGFMQTYRRIFEIAYIAGIVLIPVLLLLQSVVFPGASGVVDGVFSFLTVVAMILVAVPVVLTIIHKKADYTGAANNNAAGTAVLLDVARKVGNGCVSLEEMERMAQEAGTELEGEDAVREAGLVPEDAELEYVASSKKSETPQDSLAAAHAAIAALTGKPVPASSAYAAAPHPNDTLNPEELFAHDQLAEEAPVEPSQEEKADQVSAEASLYSTNYQDFTTRPSAQTDENSADQPEAQAQQVETFKPAPVVRSSSADGIPSWARTAQAKARENKPEQSAPSYSLRSRYADTPAALIQDGSFHQPAAPVIAAAGAGVASAAAGAVAATAAESAAAAAADVSSSEHAQVADASAKSTVDSAENSSAVVEQEAPAARRMPEPQPEVLSSDPALAARLAALRNEINSAPAPHISDEARQTFADMEAQVQKKQAVVSCETTKTAKPAEQSEAASSSSSSTEAFDAVSAEAAVDELGSKEALKEEAPAPTAESEQVEALAGNLEQTDAAPTDEYELEEQQVPSSTARSLRHQAASASSAFGGFMNKVQHMAESAAAAATEAGTHLAEKASNARVSSNNTEEAFDQPVSEQDPAEEELDYREDELVEPEQDFVVAPEGESEEVSVAENADGNAASENESAAEPKILDAMDVSAFMDKVDSEDSSDDADDETTKPVSMQEIREAMASVSDAAIPAKEAPEPSAPAPKQEEQVSPIVGIKLDSLPAIPESKGSDQIIKLPELNANEVSQVEAGSQRAPMSQDAKRSPLVSGAIPRISVGELERDSQSDRFGLDLPPLGAESDVSHEVVSATSSFSTVGGTGAFAPVGDELVEGIPEENLYVEDADDSSFEESHTETGAYAGPEYVDMPQSRVGRLFGRFGRKNKKVEQESLNEWIGADEGYTAKGAGESRESWESFREQDNSGKYEGGAFSLDNLRNIDVKSIGKRFGKAGQESKEMPVDDAFAADETKGFSITDVADAADSVDLDAVMSRPLDSSDDPAAEISQAMQHINEFRHPGIDTEVWFVGLGSEIGSNSGMRAFFDAHKDELEGAIIVNLQTLGAGRLSLIDKEGVLFPVKPSSRVKRFMRQAAERSKVSYGTAQLLSVETPGSFAIRRGYQAFSIVGVKDGKPAYYAEKDDVLDNIDVQSLEDASSFVMELLKVI